MQFGQGRTAKALFGGFLGLISGLLVTAPAVVETSGRLPVISILFPVQNQTISGQASFYVAADSAGLVALQFKVDGADLGPEITSGPCTASWDSTKAADGLHTVEAIARDEFNNLSIAQPVTVLVNNSAVVPPTSTLTIGLTITGKRRFVLTATVKQGAVHVPAGVAVTFVVVDPVGAETSYAATTDEQGVATYTGRLAAGALQGTYQVTASVSYSGASASTSGTFDH